MRLRAPLREGPVAWKLRSVRPRDRGLVFPGPIGGLWSKTNDDNWRKRAFDRARQAAGTDAATPYALRHSFASLLLHERRSVIYLARRLGDDARLTLTTRFGRVAESRAHVVHAGPADEQAG